MGRRHYKNLLKLTDGVALDGLLEHYCMEWEVRHFSGCIKFNICDGSLWLLHKSPTLLRQASIACLHVKYAVPDGTPNERHMKNETGHAPRDSQSSVDYRKGDDSDSLCDWYESENGPSHPSSRSPKTPKPQNPKTP